MSCPNACFVAYNFYDILFNESSVALLLCNRNRERTSSRCQSGNSVSLQESHLADFLHGKIQLGTLSCLGGCEGTHKHNGSFTQNNHSCMFLLLPGIWHINSLSAYKSK